VVARRDDDAAGLVRDPALSVVLLVHEDRGVWAGALRHTSLTQMRTVPPASYTQKLWIAMKKKAAYLPG
jgi:hypothetical protein